SFFSIPAFARIARAGTLRLHGQTFMLAARLSGTRTRRILLRHVTPNIMPQLVTFALLGAGVGLIQEGSRRFPGLGLPAPWPGKTLAIVGESGSGKTVSCRAVMGLLPPSAVVTGSARFAGTELIGLAEKDLRRHRGADLAMVFQDPARSLNPTMRVGAQVSEAVRSHLPLDRR